MVATELDNFTRAYIEALLWSSTGDDGAPLDRTYTLEDFAAETLARIVSDCAQFQAAHFDTIADDIERAGHDFWLTRNGHGAGFWDGDWPEFGDELTSAAHTFGELSPYVGDDGKLYF